MRRAVTVAIPGLVKHPAPPWWDWRLSAHIRLASLASLWLFLPFIDTVGPLAATIMVARLGMTALQTVLNGALGRTSPLEEHRTRADWSLFGFLCVAGLGLGALRELGIASSVAWMAVPLFALSALQVRMAARCYRTHRRLLAASEDRVPLPLFSERRAA